MRHWLIALFVSGLFGSVANAQDVRITPDMLTFETVIRGRTITIERNQDTGNRLTGGFTRTSRPCPAFCIHPMKAAPGVETVGEIEVMEFLANEVSRGTGLLIDARIPDFFRAGTIPGAVNVPFSTVAGDNPYRDDIIRAIGAVKNGANWDFSNAASLLVFCNGPWCDQSPTMIRNLIKIGYPTDKLKYYRGGMQNWVMLGLSVETPL